MYSSDYPHTDSKFPYSVKCVNERDDLPDGLLPKLLGGNAARYYGFDRAAAVRERAGDPCVVAVRCRWRRSRRPARRDRRTRHPSVAGGGRPRRRDRRPARRPRRRRRHGDRRGGVGAAAGPAIDAASYDPRVVAVCALGGPVPPTAARVFELWKDVPVLAVVEASDRDALGAAVELRFASTHPDSDIEVVSDLDVGTGSAFGSLGGRLDRCLVDRRVVARPPPGGRRRTTRGGRAQR